eukprot:scaffold42989_cov59-Phaeocystis_antarctica.AAC.1
MSVKPKDWPVCPVSATRMSGGGDGGGGDGGGGGARRRARRERGDASEIYGAWGGRTRWF